MTIHFYSHLKDVIGSPSLEVELPAGASIGTLLENLYARHPRLREWDKSLLVGAGVEFVDRDYVIKADDEIALMPPVQGG